MTIWASLAQIMPTGWHARRATTLRRASSEMAFQQAMRRWHDSARLWHLAQQHGTVPAQIHDAYAHYELDAANVRALYQQADQ